VPALQPLAREHTVLVTRKRAEFAHLAPQYELQLQLVTLGRIGAMRRIIAEMAHSSVDGPVLELCCGTGAVTAQLARSFGHVIGVDLSPDMLQRARQRMERQGLLNVQLREAEVSTVQLPKSSMASIVISLALHEMPEYLVELMLKRSMEWLKPGGRLVLSDLRSPKSRVLNFLLRHVGRWIVEPELFCKWLDYPLHARLKTLGFEAVHTHRMCLSCLEISSWTKR
jgi:ubiquinone/menaquinone biosynthesis C-methylase UbiE